MVLDKLDFRGYGPENNRNYRFLLVVTDNFSKFGWTLALKKAQTNKDSFEKILITSKISPNLIEADRGKEFYNNIFQNFSNKNNF